VIVKAYNIADCVAEIVWGEDSRELFALISMTLVHIPDLSRRGRPSKLTT
jgi:hypothetical protein